MSDPKTFPEQVRDLHRVAQLQKTAIDTAVTEITALMAGKTAEESKTAIEALVTIGLMASGHAFPLANGNGKAAALRIVDESMHLARQTEATEYLAAASTAVGHLPSPGGIL